MKLIDGDLFCHFNFFSVILTSEPGKKKISGHFTVLKSVVMRLRGSELDKPGLVSQYHSYLTLGDLFNLSSS